ALVVEDFGDAAHADAADADKVHRADVARHLHLVFPLSASASATSASVSTACGRPSDLAAAAADCKACGSPNSPASRVASECGESVDCSASQPPPAVSMTRALFFWSASSDPGSGTRIAGLPITVSSAIVEAPARAITR